MGKKRAMEGGDDHGGPSKYSKLDQNQSYRFRFETPQNRANQANTIADPKIAETPASSKKRKRDTFIAFGPDKKVRREKQIEQDETVEEPQSDSASSNHSMQAALAKTSYAFNGGNRDHSDDETPSIKSVDQPIILEPGDFKQPAMQLNIEVDLFVCVEA